MISAQKSKVGNIYDLSFFWIKVTFDFRIKTTEESPRSVYRGVTTGPLPGSRELTGLHFSILCGRSIRDHTFHLEKLIRLISTNDGESKAHVALLEGGAEERSLQLGCIPGEERLFYVGQYKLKRKRHFKTSYQTAPTSEQQSLRMWETDMVDASLWPLGEKSQTIRASYKYRAVPSIQGIMKGCMVVERLVSVCFLEISPWG